MTKHYSFRAPAGSIPSTERKHIKVYPDQHAAVKAIAAHRGVTMIQLIQTWVDENRECIPIPAETPQETREDNQQVVSSDIKELVIEIIKADPTLTHKALALL